MVFRAKYLFPKINPLFHLRPLDIVKERHSIYDTVNIFYFESLFGSEKNSFVPLIKDRWFK